MSFLLIKIIRVYQIMLSVFIGQHCRFSPTCSNYAIEAIKYHGPMKGGAMAAKRLCRCHPWFLAGLEAAWQAYALAGLSLPFCWHGMAWLAVG